MSLWRDGQEEVGSAGPTVVAGVALDDGHSDELVWQQAVNLIAGRPGATLHVCHVVERAGDTSAQEAAVPVGTMLDARAMKLYAFVGQRMRDTNAVARNRVRLHLGLGETAEELAQLGTDTDADLIVIGPAGRRRLRDAYSTTVLSRLQRRTPCAVVLARPKSDVPVGRSPQVEPPLREGQSVARRPPTYRYRRSFALSVRESEATPTGIASEDYH